MRVIILTLALIATFLHAFLSGRLERAEREALLEAHAEAVLTGELALAGLEVDFDHLDGMVRGTVPDQKTEETVLERVREALPAGRLRSELRIDPGMDFRLAGTMHDGVLQLAGKVPGEALVAGLEKSARGLGVEVERGELRVVDREVGLPWGEGTEAFFKAFAAEIPQRRLEDAGFVLGQDGLRLSGGSRGEEPRDRIVEAARGAFPSGFEIEDGLTILPHLPARLLVTRDGESVVLGGRVPTQELRERLGNLATTALNPGEMRNELQVDGAVMEPAWVSGLEVFFPAFFEGTKQGEMEIGNGALRIRRPIAASRGNGPMLKLARTHFGENFEILDQLELQPDLEPLLIAELREGVLRFEGALSSADQKERLAALAGELKREVSFENLKVDRAVKNPGWFDDIVSFLREAFGDVDSGRVAMTGGDLEVRREVETVERRNVLLAAAAKVAGRGKVRDEITGVPTLPSLLAKAEATLPEGAALIDGLRVGAMAEVKAPGPRREPQLRLVLRGGRMELEGALESEAARRKIVNAAREVAAQGSIVESIAVSKEVKPAGWLDGVAGFLPQFLGAVAEGGLEIGEEGRLVLTGTVANSEVRDGLLAALGSMMSDEVELEDRLTLSAAHGEGGDGSGETFKIYYRTGSTYINREGMAAIEAAAQSIRPRQREGLTVLVKGYADARGLRATNRALSRARAAEVYGELKRRGVDAGILEYVGVGESEASSGGGENVWRKDRRVEITLVPTGGES